MNLTLLAIIILIVTGIPLWLRASRNRQAVQRLSEADDGTTLSPRERLAVALAYPHDPLINEQVHTTHGDFSLIGLSGRDHPTYIGDLKVGVHESLVKAIERTNTARVVRARDRALVVELNGQRLLPSLDEAPAEGPEADPRRQVQLVTHTREAPADNVLRRRGAGIETGCLGTVAVLLICVGALILMLALPAAHPIWFFIGCIPLVMGVMVYRPLIQLHAPEQGERLFRLRGRVLIADSADDIPGVEQDRTFPPGDTYPDAIRRRAYEFASGPIMSMRMTWPAGLIGNLALQYPKHWLAPLRRRTPEQTDVLVTEGGEVVQHGGLSLYEEWRRFPPVHWGKHLSATILAWIALAIGAYHDTPLIRAILTGSPGNAWNGNSTWVWLNTLPATLAGAAVVLLAGYHSVRLAVSLGRWRDRQARLMPWIDAQ
ncbi:hypothetical protein V5738_18500 [Salinisphaera sp. SPP-AMP-43]|uniref:hypothetical protein n=1 Tax=Salinisphaera sp. SPP-AMP-43 TaxID=3121288 RepID=UPI003C6E10D9